MDLEYIPWLGSLQSFNNLSAAMAQADSPAALAYAEPTEPDDEGIVSPILTRQENVGILNVRGSLMNGRAGYMTRYGVTGYDDIREALAEAVAHQGISSILLRVDSGGGDVAGVHDTARMLQAVARIKPINTYTGGQMMSAAIWLGATGKKLYAGPTAETGSIGIVMVHKDYSEQFKKMGVDVTVIRAGVHKAIGNPYEPLTEKTKAAMEARAQAAYDVFMPWVAEQRGDNLTVADGKYGQGRMFVGKQAVEAGLIDSITSFEEAFEATAKLGQRAAASLSRKSAGPATPGTRVTQRYTATNHTQSPSASASQPSALAHNPAIPKETSMPTKKTIAYTEQQLVALAAGIMPDLSAEDNAPEGETEAERLVRLENEAAAAKAQAADDAAKLLAQHKPANTGDNKEPRVSPDVAAMATQLMASQREVGALGAKIESLEARVKASADEAGPFVGIARASVASMSIALKAGNTTESIAAMTPAALLAEHTRLTEMMKSTFKVGRVSAVAGDPKDQETTAKAEAPGGLFMEHAFSTFGKKN